MRRDLPLVLFALSVTLLSMAQSVEVVEQFKEVPNASVIAAYSSEFASEIREYGDAETGDFKFVVIRMNLEGDAAEAKNKVTLYCPTQKLVKTYKERPNQMLFLFPYEAKTIYVECGDGCEKNLLVEGKQLKSNVIYETAIKYTAKLLSDDNKNHKLIPVIYDKNAGEEVSFREHGDESIGFFPLSTDEIELEMGKVFDFKFSKKDEIFKDSIISYKIDNNVKIIEFPKITENDIKRIKQKQKMEKRERRKKETQEGWDRFVNGVTGIFRKNK